MDQVNMILGKRAAGGENGTEDNDDGQPPIRRSGRIAGHESDMKICPNGKTKPSNMVLTPSADGARFLGSITLDDRNKLMAEIDAAVEKKRKEEEEEKRKKEEERQIKIMIAQAKFDEDAEGIMRELQNVVLTPATIAEADHELIVVRRSIFNLIEGIKKAMRGVGTAMMECALRDARRMSDELRYCIDRFLDEQDEQKKIEEEREKRKKLEEERKKKEEEWKKKEEEDAKMTEEERKERDALEAARIAKECKICYSEMKDGMGCMVCMQKIGCNTCVTGWLQLNKSCPFCRCQYTNIPKQVKSVAHLEKVNARLEKEKARKLIPKKTRTPPTRISPRGHPSSN